LKCLDATVSRLTLHFTAASLIMLWQYRTVRLLWWRHRPALTNCKQPQLLQTFTNLMFYSFQKSLLHCMVLFWCTDMLWRWRVANASVLFTWHMQKYTRWLH